MLRHKILEKANYTCSSCKKVTTDKDLIIHHLNEFETTVLCTQCHKSLHYGEPTFAVSHWKIFPIYVPTEFYPVVTSFKEITAREGRNASLALREFIEEYVVRHEPGNPQQRIDKIAKLGKPYRADQCHFCKSKKLYVKAQVPKLGSVLLCRGCFEKKRNQLDGWKRLDKGEL